MSKKTFHGIFGLILVILLLCFINRTVIYTKDLIHQTTSTHSQKPNVEVNHISQDTHLQNLLPFCIYVFELNTSKHQHSFFNFILLLLCFILIILSFLIHRLAHSERLAKKQKAELEFLLEYDYLTGCLTKSAGLKRLNSYIDSKVPFCLAIIDIDNFKQTNDTHGHLFGDLVLKTLGENLIEGLDPRHFVIRFGGEEFLWVYKGKIDEALNSLESKRKLISQITFDNEYQLTISGGLIERHHQDLEELIEAADQLLYHSKTTGKNKISTSLD